jgi:hypothetical protein
MKRLANEHAYSATGRVLHSTGTRLCLLTQVDIVIALIVI